MTLCAIALKEFITIFVLYSIEIDLYFKAIKSYSMTFTPNNYILLIPSLTTFYKIRAAYNNVYRKILGDSIPSFFIVHVLRICIYIFFCIFSFVLLTFFE